MDAPVRVENLAKVYTVRQRRGLFKSEKHQVPALMGVSLDVRQGEIFGLLGPNGAGKTTLIKIITTLLLPTSGEAWVNGYHIQKEENKVRATVGCMLMGERGLYWKLTGRENLEYFGALYHLPPPKRKQRAAEILNMLALEDIADRTVETYSSGQKMNLAFGKALINDAPLLVLDEPTNTLDVPSASALRAIVRQLNQQGKTIIYTTHIMAEAETLCERLAIIDHGKLLALGTIEELKASLQRDQVTHVEGVISARAEAAVRALPFVLQATRTARDGSTLLTVVSARGRENLPALIETLTQGGALIQKLMPEEPTLEDVFIAKTGRTLAEDTRTRQAQEYTGQPQMQASLYSNLSIILSSTRMRLITISRYPGQIVLDIFVPIVFATLPILLGRATAGADAATVFAENTGTSNYAAYMLIGSCMFAIVSFAFWHMAYWLRWEQESGTLEALYLTPTRRVWVAAGTALYSCIRSLVSALIAYFIGSRLLNASPIQGQTGVAFLFIAIGLIPLYGLTLLFGAVILKVKEANSLVGLMQWGVSFLMGVFFPVAFFPPVLKAMALLFPPTWMANGVRSALLSTGYFLQTWYMDLAVLWAFLFIAPAFGYWVFMRTEISVRRHEGVGQF